MTFDEALEAVFKEGERITRRAWNNRQIYGCLEMGQLHIRMHDGLLHPWTLAEADYFADDWEVVDA